MQVSKFIKFFIKFGVKLGVNLAVSAKRGIEREMLGKNRVDHNEIRQQLDKCFQILRVKK